jgi:hypothetical protein
MFSDITSVLNFIALLVFAVFVMQIHALNQRKHPDRCQMCGTQDSMYPYGGIHANVQLTGADACICAICNTVRIDNKDFTEDVYRLLHEPDYAYSLIAQYFDDFIKEYQAEFTPTPKALYDLYYYYMNDRAALEAFVPELVQKALLLADPTLPSERLAFVVHDHLFKFTTEAAARETEEKVTA